MFYLRCQQLHLHALRRAACSHACAHPLALRRARHSASEGSLCGDGDADADERPGGGDGETDLHASKHAPQRVSNDACRAKTKISPPRTGQLYA